MSLVEICWCFQSRWRAFACNRLRPASSPEHEDRCACSVASLQDIGGTEPAAGLGTSQGGIAGFVDIRPIAASERPSTIESAGLKVVQVQAQVVNRHKEVLREGTPDYRCAAVESAVRCNPVDRSNQGAVRP